MIPTQISEDGLNIIRKFEGLHEQGEDGYVYSYQCPAGKWTIGYGHCKGVGPDTKATVGDCEKFLIADVHAAGEVIRAVVNVPLTPNQYSALVSFVFNLGAGNFRSSTLLKKLNMGLYQEVPAQIQRWNKARVDGKLVELNGLTRRRSAEAALWSMDTPLPGDTAGGKMPQAPQQAALKPLSQSKTLAGAGAAGLGTIGTILGDAAAHLEPLAVYSEEVKALFLTLTVAGILLVTYARVKDHKEGIH